MKVWCLFSSKSNDFFDRYISKCWEILESSLSFWLANFFCNGGRAFIENWQWAHCIEWSASLCGWLSEFLVALICRLYAIYHEYILILAVFHYLLCRILLSKLGWRVLPQAFLSILGGCCVLLVPWWVYGLLSVFQQLPKCMFGILLKKAGYNKRRVLEDAWLLSFLRLGWKGMPCSVSGGSEVQSTSR